MSKTGMLKSFCNWVHNRYAGESGKMLIHTGVIGWTLSALAQVGAIVINNEIPSDQKKFLIPQEIADAAINIASFYVVTTAVKNFALKFATTGKFATPKIRKFINDSIAKKLIKKEDIGKLSLNLDNVAKLQSEDMSKAYHSFKGGVDVIGTTIGSVLSSNIITPIFRNKFAAAYQKESLNKNKKGGQKLVSPRGITMNEYMAMTNRSGMKI